LRRKERRERGLHFKQRGGGGGGGRRRRRRRRRRRKETGLGDGAIWTSKALLSPPCPLFTMVPSFKKVLCFEAKQKALLFSPPPGVRPPQG